MSNRKYPKVQDYWVYSIYVQSVDKYYIGISKQQCSRRWQKVLYKKNSIEPYLDEWDSMIKTVIQDNLTKEEAVKLEDDLIVKYTQEGKCINERRSGWVKKNDVKAYEREHQRKYRENNRKELNKYHREYRTKNRERRNKKARERYKTDEEFREKECKRQRERRAKKKLDKLQQNQLTLFDLAS